MQGMYTDNYCIMMIRFERYTHVLTLSHTMWKSLLHKLLVASLKVSFQPKLKSFIVQKLFSALHSTALALALILYCTLWFEDDTTSDEGQSFSCRE